MKYTILIKTTFRKIVDIEADSEEEALAIAQEDGEGNLDTVDFDTETEVMKW